MKRRVKAIQKALLTRAERAKKRAQTVMTQVANSDSSQRDRSKADDKTISREEKKVQYYIALFEKQAQTEQKKKKRQEAKQDKSAQDDDSSKQRYQKHKKDPRKYKGAEKRDSVKIELVKDSSAWASDEVTSKSKPLMSKEKPELNLVSNNTVSEQSSNKQVEVLRDTDNKTSSYENRKKVFRVERVETPKAKATDKNKPEQK